MTLNASATAKLPFAGLYDFVKTHLVVVNGVVLASGTLVGALDFLAPRLSFVPSLVYSATACLALAMLAAALMPKAMSATLGRLGLASQGVDSPLWRRPAWQFSLAMLVGISLLGFASVAKAAEGGQIASRFPAARQMQVALLSLSKAVSDIGVGVAAANGKLDRLVANADDPWRALAARGYARDDSGLASAIKQGDAKAIGLFAQTDFKAQTSTPISILLDGSAWSDEVASALPVEMFQSPDTCATSLLHYELPEPLARRMALYKRLCGGSDSVASLRRGVASDRSQVDANPWQARQRVARRRNLSLLGG